MVDLKPKYPKQKNIGTEVPNTKNLESPRKKGTDPKLIKIPKACKNLALEKFVTSSHEDPIEGELDYITDGDSTADEFVQLKEGIQWVQIDLEKLIHYMQYTFGITLCNHVSIMTPSFKYLMMKILSRASPLSLTMTMIIHHQWGVVKQKTI